MEEGEPIEHKLISRGIENAQKKVEGHNFNIRKNLLEYDDVMNKHREIVYSLRKGILFARGIGEIVREMIDDKIDGIATLLINPKDDPEDWNMDELMENLFRHFGFRVKVGPKDMGEDAFSQLKVEGLVELIKKQVQGAYEEKERLFGKEELEHVERYILLQIIDDKWVAHLQSMDHMKEGIGLRGYGQLDPLKEYQKEGFALFAEFLEQIREEALGHIFRLRIVRHEPEERMRPKKKNLNLSHGDDSVSPTTVRRKEK
ncbi:MAG: preprotein translocase subunit SecA, partial [Desulfobulbaceae bacterium]|nr:preprotein translocase subunit SecA [Desulfobulbaceae bacterium]